MLSTSIAVNAEIFIRTTLFYKVNVIILFFTCMSMMTVIVELDIVVERSRPTLEPLKSAELTWLFSDAALLQGKTVN